MRSAWVEVDLSRIEENVHALLRRAAPAAGMAVVKAAAYGHGAVPVAKAAVEAGASWLGVALLQEARELREHDLRAPILVLGHLGADEWDEAISLSVSAAISTEVQLRAALYAARRLKRPARVHVKVDTGMGRLGAHFEDAETIALEVMRHPELRLEGVFSHLAMADDPESSVTDDQLARFAEVVTAVRKLSAKPIYHVLNSAGVLRYGSSQALDLVRLGIAMYGLNPDGRSESPFGLSAALSLKALISHVKKVPEGTPLGYGHTFRTDRPSTIATVPIGYADGYRRGLSNRAAVVIKGQRCRVVGRISMDQLTVLVPEGTQVTEGDEVVLIGRQGDAEVTAGELAGMLDTISYEIVAGLSARLPRLYLNGKGAAGGQQGLSS